MKITLIFKSQKKFLVIFRGINTEYFDPNNIKQEDIIKLKSLGS